MSRAGLTDLDGGEPKRTTDFRSVYAAALQDWLAVPTDGLFGEGFEAVKLFVDR